MVYTGIMIDTFAVVEAINRIQFDVRNFSRSRDGNSFQWSCDICGDSTTDLRKARFGVTRKGSGWVCHCFNCGYSNNFVSYLRQQHPAAYEELSIQKLKQTATSLFDHNDIFKQGLDDETLLILFYGNERMETKQWVEKMRNQKISLTKENFERLFRTREKVINNS